MNITYQKTGIPERKLVRKSPFSVGYYNFQPAILTDTYPAKLPPDLADECILQWSDVGDLVLDPFVGSGTTLRSAVKFGRRAVGLDINPEAIRLCREYPELKDCRLEVCDSRKVPLPDECIDFVFGSPPYGTIIAGKKVAYSKDPSDISNAKSYDEYLLMLLPILRECYRVLKSGGLLALVIKERNKKEELHLQPLPAYILVYGGMPKGEQFTIQGVAQSGVGFWKWTHRVLPTIPYMIWTFGPENRRKAIPQHEELVVLRKPTIEDEPEAEPEPIPLQNLDQYFG